MPANTNNNIIPASFRDPSGFVFLHNGIVYRQINKCYAANYSLLMESGLYEKLTVRKKLIPHTELKESFFQDPEHYLTIQPEQIPFISYPYEWSFSQLKDAALLTLSILKQSLQAGLILKDASAFNIQFVGGKPCLIDTLSFEKYDEQNPWVAYKQFCEHFLNPLIITHYTGINANKLLGVYINGISSQTTARLLPFKSYFSSAAWMHIFLANKMVVKNKNVTTSANNFSKKKLQLLIDNLTNTISKLNCRNDAPPVWSDYYESTILSKKYLDDKSAIIHRIINELPVETALDLGANDGHFSKLVATKAKTVIATDFDELCIDNLYKAGIENILPLVVDIANPSPAIGFAHEERDSFSQRFNCDLVLALALIHHLYFAANIPFHKLAQWLHKLSGKYLIIEFVTAEDEKVKIITNRLQHDNVKAYTRQAFEEIFSQWFDIIQVHPLANETRWIYFMQTRNL